MKEMPNDLISNILSWLVQIFLLERETAAALARTMRGIQDDPWEEDSGKHSSLSLSLSLSLSPVHQNFLCFIIENV